MEQESKGMLLGGLGVIGFGLTLPATRVLVPYLDPIFIGLGRSVVAAFFAAIILTWFRQPLPKKKQLLPLAIVALGVVIGFPIFASLAMIYIPASHGGVVAGVLPLATAIIGVMISHERPSMGFWFAGSFGSFSVLVYMFLQGSGELQLGDFALLAAIASAALGYAVGGKLAKDLGGWQVICWALVLSAPFILFPAIYFRPESLFNLPLEAYGSFLYLALISQLVAFIMWYKGLALGGIARVSQTQLIQPFITIGASVWLLGEHLDLATILFALLVVSSVWIGKKMPIYEKETILIGDKITQSS